MLFSAPVTSGHKMMQCRFNSFSEPAIYLFLHPVTYSQVDFTSSGKILVNFTQGTMRQDGTPFRPNI